MRVKKFELSELDVRFETLGNQLEKNLEEKLDSKIEKLESQRKQDLLEFKRELREDAKEREERLMQDAREREQKYEQRTQSMEERHMADRREFRSQKRWLIANFVGVAAIIFGFFLAVIGFVVAVANGYVSL